MIMDNFSQLVLYFAIYSFCGWICETVYCSIYDRKLVKRGFLRGPYCPIYGFGAILVLILCLPVDRYPLLVFLVAMVAASILEYFGFWVLETFFQMRLWDYSNNKLNIKGRVCLLNSTLFGFLGLAAVYLLHPFTEKLIGRLTDEHQGVLAGLCVLVFGLDFLQTVATVTGLRERLRSIRGYVEELKRYHERYDWFIPGDLSGSLKRVKDICEKNVDDQVAIALKEKLESLIAKKDNSYRLLKSYPRLNFKGFGEELAELRKGLALKRDKIAEKFK